MGKGDKKTKKGKINAGSYGRVRNRKNQNTIGREKEATVKKSQEKKEEA